MMLSSDLLPLLRRYWKLYQPQSWLFPGPHITEPITRMDVTHICRQAGYAAKLTKTIYSHLLRHSFGTVTLGTLHRDKNPRTAPQNCGVCAHLISEP